jgi:tetratricopeptide (TPR) repeat protein
MRDREYPHLGDDKIVDPFWDLQEEPVRPPSHREGLRDGFSGRTNPKKKKKVGRFILIFLMGLAIGWGLNALISGSSDTNGRKIGIPIRGLLFEKTTTDGSSSGGSVVELAPQETLSVKYGRESLKYVRVIKERSIWSRLKAYFSTPPQLYLGERIISPGEDLAPYFEPEKSLKLELMLKESPQSPPLATFWIQLGMDPQAWLARADALKDPTAKRACLEKALQMAPDSVDLLMAMASLLWKQRDSKSAERYLRKAAKLDPKNVEARKTLAVMLKKERPREALKLYEELVSLDPENRIKYYHTISQIQLSLGISPEETYKRILALNPKDETALKGLESLHAGHLRQAKKWQKRGNLLKAIQEAKKALALRNSKEIRVYISALYNNLGFSLSRKKPKEAIKYYLSSLKYERSPATYLNLADLYYRTGQKKRALKALSSALALKPRDKKVLKGIYILLGEISIDQKDYNGAIKHLRQAMAKLPKDHDVAVALSKAYWKKGDLDKAAATLKKALKLMGSRPKKEIAAVHRTLGDIYRLMGEREKDLKAKISKYDKALAAYKKALSLDDQDKEAQRLWEEVAGERKALKIKLLQSS